MVNYLAEIPEYRGGDDPVTRTARALIAAGRRNVDVQVVLEGIKIRNNYAFYRLLKDAGIDTWMDTSLTFVHHKVAVFDDRSIIVGSHNITRAALTDHEEYSVITDDAGTIRRFEHELKKVLKQREMIRKNICRDVVLLPRGFLAEAGALFRAHAGNAFDLYLKLCRDDGGRPRAIDIAFEKWGAELGFDPRKAGKVTTKYVRHFYEQRINRILYQLKRAGLIDIDRDRDTVTRRRFKAERPEPALSVPVTYWRYGWSRRLSFAAKYFYLISLAETSGSPFYPWWSLSLKAAAQRYGYWGDIGRAARELEARGILEILRAEAVKRGKTYSEEAQFYRVNPFPRE